MTETSLIISVLVITLLNLGLVTLALSRINGLRKDLRTPVVKKFPQDFKQDFKRKPVDIPKAPESFGKNQRDDKAGRQGNQPYGQNRPRNGQQNRPTPMRRPAAKAPDVYSNEAPAPQASAPVPPRPVSTEDTSVMEGRRPLPPRFNGNPADNVPAAPQAPVNFAANDSNNGDDDSGMEFDRSKMAHGRRNVVAKPVIEDDAEGNT